MASRDKSAIQRFVTRFVGAETAAAIEAHSRAWRVQCPSCGFERSIWDLGGIRYKAAGRPRLLLRCPSCGRAGWHKVEKAADFPSGKAPMGGLIGLILSVMIGVMILVALIVGIILWLAGAV